MPALRATYRRRPSTRRPDTVTVLDLGHKLPGVVEETSAREGATREMGERPRLASGPTLAHMPFEVAQAGSAPGLSAIFKSLTSLPRPMVFVKDGRKGGRHG